MMNMRFYGFRRANLYQEMQRIKPYTTVLLHFKQAVHRII